jgi:hypothetical protein
MLATKTEKGLLKAETEHAHANARINYMLCISAFVLNLNAGTPAAAQTVSGIGRSKDGDSLMLDQTEVRLFGVDA